MWNKVKAQYRKTVIPVQMVIITIGVIAYFNVGLVPALYYMCAMEIFAVLGAMWAVRLRGKFENRKKGNDSLPDLMV